MRVIGAGLPRTATTTTMIAFEMLGFAPCYHMRDVLGDMEKQVQLWEAVVEGKPDWPTIFGDAQSSCDWPSSAFYAEQLEAYPEAKVVLTVRSPEGWVQSMRETVWPIYFGDSVMHHLNDARRVVDPIWRRYLEMLEALGWKEGGALAPSERTFTDEGLAAAMNDWTERVKGSVPSDRLLIWEPKEGWGPLCDFLEVNEPGEPLPNTNDTAAFKEGILGGAMKVIGDWWDQRERPSEGLHGAAAPEG